MKLRNAALVQFRAQVNQHVAATDQVEPCKWRIGRDILTGKRAGVAHVAMDLVSAVALHKKTFQSRKRNIFFDSAGINSQPRMFDHRFAQIGAENLDAYFGRTSAERFQNAYRERINFFAGGATRHPRAKLWLSIFAFISEQRRHEAFLQGAEEGFVPEKPSHVDQQIV